MALGFLRAACSSLRGVYEESGARLFVALRDGMKQDNRLILRQRTSD